MVRTRFAPSPTGSLHIGNLRTAVYAYALAKHSRGQFILRIEDTDQKREVAGVTDSLQATLHKFGLAWDDYQVQSQRAAAGVYSEAARRLVAADRAFYCQCPAKNAKEEGFSTILRDPCRDRQFTSGAVKLKVPAGQTVGFTDFVHRKDISWSTDTVYDATLLKSDGLPTYHLAMPVDDLAMDITHVLRGHDWMPSTPVHLLVFDYLGAGRRPEIGHLSDILNAQSGKKLSKRRDSVFVEQFLEAGYLPEALLNFVILLGWAPKDNRELYTLAEFVAEFDPAGFQHANPKFFYTKLDWINGYYLRQKSDTELTQLVKPFMKINISDNVVTQAVPLVKERLVKLSDVDALLLPFVTAPSYVPDLWTGLAAYDHLTFATARFSSLKAWTKSDLEDGLVDAVRARGWKVGDFFMSLRVAVFGTRQTPPVTDSMVIIGQEESLSRLAAALASLNHS